MSNEQKALAAQVGSTILTGAPVEGSLRAHAPEAFKKFKAAAKRVIVTHEVLSLLNSASQELSEAQQEYKNGKLLPSQSPPPEVSQDLTQQQQQRSLAQITAAAGTSAASANNSSTTSSSTAGTLRKSLSKSGRSRSFGKQQKDAREDWGHFRLLGALRAAPSAVAAARYNPDGYPEQLGLSMDAATRAEQEAWEYQEDDDDYDESDPTWREVLRDKKAEKLKKRYMVDWAVKNRAASFIQATWRLHRHRMMKLAKLTLEEALRKGPKTAAAYHEIHQRLWQQQKSFKRSRSILKRSQTSRSPSPPPEAAPEVISATPPVAVEPVRTDYTRDDLMAVAESAAAVAAAAAAAAAAQQKEAAAAPKPPPKKPTPPVVEYPKKPKVKVQPFSAMVGREAAVMTTNKWKSAAKAAAAANMLAQGHLTYVEGESEESLMMTGGISHQRSGVPVDMIGSSTTDEYTAAAAGVAAEGAGSSSSKPRVSFEDMFSHRGDADVSTSAAAAAVAAASQPSIAEAAEAADMGTATAASKAAVEDAEQEDNNPTTAAVVEAITPIDSKSAEPVMNAVEKQQQQLDQQRATWLAAQQLLDAWQVSKQQQQQQQQQQESNQGEQEPGLPTHNSAAAPAAPTTAAAPAEAAADDRQPMLHINQTATAVQHQPVFTTAAADSDALTAAAGNTELQQQQQQQQQQQTTEAAAAAAAVTSRSESDINSGLTSSASHQQQQQEPSCVLPASTDTTSQAHEALTHKQLQSAEDASLAAPEPHQEQHQQRQQQQSAATKRRSSSSSLAGALVGFGARVVSGLASIIRLESLTGAIRGTSSNGRGSSSGSSSSSGSNAAKKAEGANRGSSNIGGRYGAEANANSNNNSQRASQKIDLAGNNGDETLKKTSCRSPAAAAAVTSSDGFFIDPDRSADAVGDDNEHSISDSGLQQQSLQQEKPSVEVAAAVAEVDNSRTLQAVSQAPVSSNRKGSSSSSGSGGGGGGSQSGHRSVKKVLSLKSTWAMITGNKGATAAAAATNKTSSSSGGSDVSLSSTLQVPVSSSSLMTDISLSAGLLTSAAAAAGAGSSSSDLYRELTLGQTCPAKSSSIANNDTNPTKLITSADGASIDPHPVSSSSSGNADNKIETVSGGDDAAARLSFAGLPVLVELEESSHQQQPEGFNAANSNQVTMRQVTLPQMQQQQQQLEHQEQQQQIQLEQQTPTTKPQQVMSTGRFTPPAQLTVQPAGNPPAVTSAAAAAAVPTPPAAALFIDVCSSPKKPLTGSPRKHPAPPAAARSPLAAAAAAVVPAAMMGVTIGGQGLQFVGGSSETSSSRGIGKGTGAHAVAVSSSTDPVVPSRDTTDALPAAAPAAAAGVLESHVLMNTPTGMSPRAARAVLKAGRGGAKQFAAAATAQTAAAVDSSKQLDRLDTAAVCTAQCEPSDNQPVSPAAASKQQQYLSTLGQKLAAARHLAQAAGGDDDDENDGSHLTAAYQFDGSLNNASAGKTLGSRGSSSRSSQFQGLSVDVTSDNYNSLEAVGNQDTPTGRHSSSALSPSKLQQQQQQQTRNPSPLRSPKSNSLSPHGSIEQSVVMSPSTNSLWQVSRAGSRVDASAAVSRKALVTGNQTVLAQQQAEAMSAGLDAGSLSVCVSSSNLHSRTAASEVDSSGESSAVQQQQETATRRITWNEVPSPRTTTTDKVPVAGTPRGKITTDKPTAAAVWNSNVATAAAAALVPQRSSSQMLGGQGRIATGNISISHSLNHAVVDQVPLSPSSVKFLGAHTAGVNSAVNFAQSSSRASPLSPKAGALEAAGCSSDRRQQQPQHQSKGGYQPAYALGASAALGGLSAQSSAADVTGFVMGLKEAARAAAAAGQQGMGVSPPPMSVRAAEAGSGAAAFLMSLAAQGASGPFKPLAAGQNSSSFMSGVQGGGQIGPAAAGLLSSRSMKAAGRPANTGNVSPGGATSPVLPSLSARRTFHA